MRLMLLNFQEEQDTYTLLERSRYLCINTVHVSSTLIQYSGLNVAILYKYHHSTKLYQRACCRLYCYEWTMPTATK